VAAQVAGELLVAKTGEPFLERELEPVAAGDPVAGPVVEVLVRDDALDLSKSASVAVSGEARITEELKTFSPLFSMAPMLKSSTATMLKTSRSYSRP
jgi:hypothetical protein